MSRKRTRGLLAGATVASILGTAATLALAGPAAAGALFVSASSGSDSNPCTAPQPCKTIGHAVALAGSGSTISVAAGTYKERSRSDSG